MENESKKKINKKENIKEADVVSTDKAINEKRCIKCNNILLDSDDYCYICGANQRVVRKNKKEKNSSNSLLYVFIFLLLFLMCFMFCYSVYKYFDNGHDNINYSNRSVTVDDTGIADAVEKVYDSVVVVENYVNGKLYATGSGFVYKTDNNYGYILTNNHVIANSTEVYLKFTKDIDEKVKAEVVGNDDFSDIAVLKVPKKYIVQVAVLGDNSKMRVGDTTFAVGTPLDAKAYSWSVTRGILSGKDRVVSSGTSYMNVLQTDTPINSGNSGGPLVNINGEVIGVNSVKLVENSVEGMGFAIPIETATNYADQFVSGEVVDRPYIGVSVYDATQSFFSSEVYVVVNSVEAGSAAEKAGIKAGDVITKINGETVENSSYFKYKLYQNKPGDTIKITVQRNNKELTFDVKLGTNKKSN